MTEKFRLTREHVFETADAIYREGEHPSTVKVFQRIGRGSMTTIQKYLKEWRPEVGSGEKESVEMPADVRDAVSRFALEMWRRLSAVTQGELEAVRKNASDEVTRVQSEFAQMAEMADSLQGELEGVTGDRERLSNDLERIKRELAEEKGKAIERENRLMIAIDEKIRFQDEVRQLDRALSKTREQVTTLEKNVEGMTKCCHSLEDELGERTKELAAARKERDTAKGEVLAATKVEENLRRELEKEEGRGRELTGKVDELSARLTEEAAKRAALEERLSHLEGKS
jgi:chromosome segregation ATPase